MLVCVSKGLDDKASDIQRQQLIELLAQQSQQRVNRKKQMEEQERIREQGPMPLRQWAPTAPPAGNKFFFML